jgi:hypothetical protein
MDSQSSDGSVKSGIRNVRIMRSLLLMTRSRPVAVARIKMIMLLVRRFEYIVSHVLLSIMLIHPLFVPAIMWSPEAVKHATVVVIFASCAACFSESSSSVLRGAEGSGRLTGLDVDMSTSIGCSSNKAATKTRWFLGCSSAMKTGASNRTVRTLEPSFRSQSTAFQSCDAVRMYRSFEDQLRDCICAVCPLSLRATPFVSMSNMATVPSRRPDASRSPR